MPIDIGERTGQKCDIGSVRQTRYYQGARNMIGMVAESIIVAFILGAVIGVITTMHIIHQHNIDLQKTAVPVKNDRDHSRRQ